MKKIYEIVARNKNGELVEFTHYGKRFNKKLCLETYDTLSKVLSIEEVTSRYISDNFINNLICEINENQIISSVQKDILLDMVKTYFDD